MANLLIFRFNREVIRRNRWVRNEYTAHGMRMREEIFLSIAHFAHMNRPITGYYFEFGSHGANTMRMAWKHFRHLFDWTFVAFDSFEGLPEPEAGDTSTIFRKGNLATEEKTFIARCQSAGMPINRLITVKGFYEASLTPELRERLLPSKAAVIYIDCDLYASAVPVLEFIVPFLQQGTIIVFDDWNCFHANPDRGERRAWREFLSAHPELHFEPFITTHAAASFIHVARG